MNETLGSLLAVRDNKAEVTEKIIAASNDQPNKLYIGFTEFAVTIKISGP